MKRVPVLLLFVVLLLGVNQSSNAQNLENIKSGGKIKISGQLGASMVFYNVTGREANRPAFSWMLVGNPVVDIYGLSLPFSLTISEQQRSFQQPFNKFGVSPSYKWAKLHLGYRDVNFSKYTLGGHTMLGVGGEFTPGKFRLGFMYGRLMKAVDADPITQNEPFTSRIPTYRRDGLSFKVGYGTNANFIDFVLFKGHDILNSIDTLSQHSVAPAENVVFSIITKQRFLKKFEFYLEYANSIFTKDARLDSLPPSGISSPFSGLIAKNSSTSQGSAIETYFGYSMKVFNIKLRFKQIDPGFNSLGTYFIQNDLRNITIEPGVNLASGKYIIGSSLGFQRDNLKNTLTQQTNRTIWSMRFSARPINWYNLDVSYSNFEISQSKANYSLDSLYKISQTTQSITVTQNFSVTGTTFMHNFLLSFNNQKLTDNNKVTENTNSYTTNMWMGSYMVSYMPLRLNMSLTYTYSHFKLDIMDTKYFGPVISFSTSFFKNKMNLALSDSYFNNRVNSLDVSNINILSFTTSYRLKKNHQFKARYNLHTNNAMDASISSYRETTGEIGYSFIF
ncbi:MAG TPA: hypothetical protein VMW01_11050 [Williamwhitmania sp.]|nr:hypothetical protein [Williamwhitmania sp.]